MVFIVYKNNIKNLVCYITGTPLFYQVYYKGLKMNSFKKFISAFFYQSKAATLVEYGMLVALMSAIAIVSLINLGAITLSVFETTNDRLKFASTAIDGTERRQSDPMIMRVNTGLTSGTLVGFIVNSSTGLVDLEVDWGDGSSPMIILSGGPVFYEYANDGIYTIQLKGKFEDMTLTGIGADSVGKLIAVTSWGDIQPVNLNGAFERTVNLATLPMSIPASVRSLKGALFASRYNGLEIKNWDVKNITDMSLMFAANTQFNQLLNTWDTSSVKNMSAMFRDTSSFNQVLFSWNVSNVEDFSSMFKNSSFSGGVDSWDTSSAKNMSSMFRGNTAFNGNISSWNVANVEDFSEMFRQSTSFNQDISTWNTTNAKDMEKMFAEASSFNAPIGVWDTGKVTSFKEMFYAASSFNQPLNSWNTSVAKDMESMFAQTSFNSDISGWNTQSLIVAASMFQGNTAFNQNISSWNTTNIQDFASMFEQATAFNINISGWNTTSARKMDYMFSGASAFNQDISSWNVGNVSQFASMFEGASSFNADLGNWDVASVTSPVNMARMFNNASAYAGSLSCWDVIDVVSRPTLFSDGSLMAAEPLWGTPSGC